MMRYKESLLFRNMQVYLHHIAFYDGINSADLCGGANLQGRDALWSIGAESRHTPTFFPDSHGIAVGQNSSWAANIHLIRTHGVPHVSLPGTDYPASNDIFLLHLVSGTTIVAANCRRKRDLTQRVKVSANFDG